MILDKQIRVPIDEIANLSRKIILGENHNNFDLAEILNDIYGISIYYSDTDKFDGYLGLEKVDSQNKPMIVLNSNQPEDRQLFTLAHELGHLIIHYGYLPGVREVDIEAKQNVLSISGYYRTQDLPVETTDPKELQANQFAGTFLMPEKTVEELTQGIDSFTDKVTTLAKNLGVTTRAARKRLQVLEQAGEES